MSETVISLDKVRQELKEKDLREFIEMCKANAPEFVPIEDLAPMQSEVVTLHKIEK